MAGRVFDRMKLGDSQKVATDTGKPYEIDFLPPQAMDPGIAWYYIDLVHTTKPSTWNPLPIVTGKQVKFVDIGKNIGGSIVTGKQTPFKRWKLEG